MADIVYLHGELNIENELDARTFIPDLIKGDTGPEGKSAYQVALDEGFVGTKAQWLASLKGDTGATGADGNDGSFIWKTSTAPSTPNYTFTITNLTGPSGKTPKVGDAVFYSSYYYIVSSVGTTTVRAETRTSIKGSTGAAGQNYTITQNDYNAIALVVIGLLDIAEQEAY